MKRERVILIVAAIGISILALEVRVLTPTLPINVSEAMTASAIGRGFAFLDTKWDGEGFRDDYLEYAYPGESLECPTGCNLTYRKLDAYFDLKLLDDIPGSERIEEETDFAGEVLESLVPEWRAEPIYNTIRTNGSGIALDSYCILGFLYSDLEMAGNVAGHLDGNNLLADDYYSADVWRNIADETWCIRLFQETGIEPNLTNEMAREKIREAREFLGTGASDIDKAAVLVHMIPLLEEGGFPSEEFRAGLLELSKKTEAAGNTLIVSNILEVLSRHGREETEFLADILIERQGVDGGWEPEPGSPSGRVFATFRAIKALDEFRRAE